MLDFRQQILGYLKLPPTTTTPTLETLIATDSSYLKDMLMNLTSFDKSNDLTPREQALIGLAIANNNKNPLLQTAFTHRAKTANVSDNDIAEALACSSWLSTNNVIYRFRHFMEKPSYDQMRMGLRMNIMMKPTLGKEFYELLSTALSAVNGCELCVQAHEHSLLKLGTSEQRIFAAVRLAGVVTGIGKVLY